MDGCELARKVSFEIPVDKVADVATLMALFQCGLTAQLFTLFPPKRDPFL